VYSSFGSESGWWSSGWEPGRVPLERHLDSSARGVLSDDLREIAQRDLSDRWLGANDPQARVEEERDLARFRRGGERHRIRHGDRVEGRRQADLEVVADGLGRSCRERDGQERAGEADDAPHFAASGARSAGTVLRK
jgi:hypothetical protein